MSALQTYHICFRPRIRNGISTKAHQFALLYVPEKGILLTAPPPRAGPGYELHRGMGYYKIHSEPKTWHEARQICVQEGVT